MQDFTDLKRRWEEAWRALKETEKLPPALTPVWWEEPDKATEMEKQAYRFSQLYEARERERELRRALLRQGPEGKQYVRQTIYSDLLQKCRREEAFLEEFEKRVPDIVRRGSEKEGVSEEELQFEARRVLEHYQKKLESLKEQLRELEDR